jgi:hypothetical protein
MYRDLTPEEWASQVGPGWRELVVTACRAAQERGATILQVKEKFGTLRIYHMAPGGIAVPEIDQAERDSRYLCERCGQPGKLRENHGWLSTRCEQCWTEEECAR